MGEGERERVRALSDSVRLELDGELL